MTERMGRGSAAEKLHGEIGQGQEAEGEEDGRPDVLNFHEVCSGLETAAAPDSVNSAFRSASLALARCIEIAVVSIQPAPVSSPVRTSPFSMSSSCCSILASSCLHHAMNRSGADMAMPAFLPPKKNQRRGASVPPRETQKWRQSPFGSCPRLYASENKFR